MPNYSQHLPLSTGPGVLFDRVLTETAQTGLYEGREFRAFKELNIAVGATYVIKIVVAVDTLLHSLFIELDAGWLRASSKILGVEGGVFSESISPLPANNMSFGKNRRADFGVASGLAAYSPKNIITAGGTHTGGTELDVVRVKCSGNSQQASSVGASAFDERGVAANTYYIEMLNLGNDIILGTIKLRWEEKP